MVGFATSSFYLLYSFSLDFSFGYSFSFALSFLSWSLASLAGVYLAGVSALF
jgi:hypothetical protein